MFKPLTHTVVVVTLVLLGCTVSEARANCALLSAFDGQWKFTALVTGANDYAKKAVPNNFRDFYDMKATVERHSADKCSLHVELSQTGTMMSIPAKERRFKKVEVMHGSAEAVTAYGESWGQSVIMVPILMRRPTSLSFDFEGGKWALQQDSMRFVTFYFDVRGNVLTGHWHLDGQAYNAAGFVGGLVGQRNTRKQPKASDRRVFSRKLNCFLDHCGWTPSDKTAMSGELDCGTQFMACIGGAAKPRPRPVPKTAPKGAKASPDGSKIIVVMPPEPKSHPPRVQQGKIWMKGYYVWNDKTRSYDWNSGRFRRAKPGKKWIPGNYKVAVRGGYKIKVWTPGSWR